MTAIAITLSVALLAAVAGLVYLGRELVKAHREVANATDLRRSEHEVADRYLEERDEAIRQHAAADAKLREAVRRLAEAERQRNDALREAQERIAKEIRNAPDAVAALNSVLAATDRGGVQQAEVPDAAQAGADGPSGERPGSLLATQLL